MRKRALAAIACLIFGAGPLAALPVEKCINLSNYLEVPKGDGWTYPHKPEHIDRIAEAGFDTLRLPVNAADHWTGPALEPDFAARVQAVVDRARAAGLFVIVDLHHYDAFVSDPTANAGEFLDIWRALAAMFEGQGGLAFELLNEPTAETNIDELLPLYTEALAVIREKHPEAWVIYGGTHWNRLGKMLDLPRTDDPRVAHTFHYYQPGKFTHQQAPWHDNPHPPRNWGSDEERAAVTADLERAGAHHTPVFLGEFGVINAAPRADRLAWIAHVRREAERAGLPWCHWGFGARFGALDPAADAWDQGVLDALFD